MKNSRLFSGFVAIMATVETNCTFTEDPRIRCRLAAQTIAARRVRPPALAQSTFVVTDSKAGFGRRSNQSNDLVKCNGAKFGPKAWTSLGRGHTDEAVHYGSLFVSQADSTAIASELRKR